MAGINEEMNLLAQDDIKVEDVEIKVEVDDWPWVEDLQQIILHQMPLPLVPQAQMNPPLMNEVEDIPRHNINIAPVQAEIPQVQEVTQGQDRMNQPHVDLLEPSVELSLHRVVCTCLVKKSMFTRSQARRHKENCYEIYN